MPTIAPVTPLKDGRVLLNSLTIHLKPRQVPEMFSFLLLCRHLIHLNSPPRSLPLSVLSFLPSFHGRTNCDEISPCSCQYSLCTVSIVVTVPSESTLVFITLHTFQVQLCCTVMGTAASAVLAQDRVHVSLKRSKPRLIGGTWLAAEN